MFRWNAMTNNKHRKPTLRMMPQVFAKTIWLVRTMSNLFVITTKVCVSCFYYCTWWIMPILTYNTIEKAKELGIWRENDMPFELTTENLYRGIPGSSSKQILDLYRMSDMKTLPPPPTISGLPQPPPKVLHDSVQEKRQLLGNILQTIGET